jgi:hypothetical protein
VAHPGRGKPGKLINLSWLDELEAESSTAGLPLFDWAEQQVSRPSAQSFAPDDC